MDIEACHRLPRSSKSKHALLLVRFTNRRIRGTVLGVRKKLHESKKDIFVNEHLTKRANEIFAATRHLQNQNRIRQSWTSSGRVIVRLLDARPEKFLPRLTSPAYVRDCISTVTFRLFCYYDLFLCESLFTITICKIAMLTNAQYASN